MKHTRQLQASSNHTSIIDDLADCAVADNQGLNTRSLHELDVAAHAA
jgi:hypothetical protein